MKKLTKIKLINWHLFNNQTIEVNGNALLSGENGAGKSTFLDAIQYVLTGGKAKFNTAANTNARRDIIGYIRCKLGIENKPFLRENDVTTHIALEFNDSESKKFMVIGVILELNRSGRVNEHFYHLLNTKMNDDLFFDGEIIRTYSLMNRYLKSLNIHVNFVDRKEQAKKMVLDALEIRNEKYTELIPKALAFKPIDELNKFVFDFLLNEKKVNIFDLRQNVRNYRQIEAVIKLLKAKEIVLKEIEAKYSLYEKYLQEIGQYHLVQGYASHDLYHLKMNQLEQEIKDLGEEERYNDKTKTALNESLINIDKEIIDLTQSLNNNDTFKYMKDLERKIMLNHNEVKGLKSELNQLRNVINSELELCKYIYTGFEKAPVFNEFLESSELNKDFQTIHFNQKTNQLKTYYKELKEKTNSEIYELSNEQNQLNRYLNDINDNINQLEKNQFKYEEPVSKLRQLIDEEVTRVTQKDYKTYVFCELLEVTDPEWRNALEGYLNTQRFDLIVEPEYFDIALRVYDKNKYKANLHGVGIVDTQKLKNYQDVAQNSLATKLTSKMSIHAKNYANMILNQVICCDNLDDLKNHRTSITKTCMVYKNHTARQIKEDVYKRPFIGNEAKRLQLIEYKSRKVELEKKLVNLNTKIRSLNELYRKLDNHQLDYLIYNSKNVEKYFNLEEQLVKDKLEFEKLRLDSSWIGLQEQLNKKIIEKTQLTVEKDELTRKSGELSKDRSIKISELELINEKRIEALNEKTKLMETYHSQLNNADIEYKRLLKYYKEGYEQIINYCKNKLFTHNEAVINSRNEINNLMSHYNTTYHFGAAPLVSEIKEYQNELIKISSYDLIEQEENAKVAREKCETAFKEQFISKLRENIIDSHKEIADLNKALKDKKFGGDEYEFIHKPNTHIQYQQYYKLILSAEDFYTNTLFSETMSDQNRLIMKELFDKLAIDESDEDAERSLEQFTDYRNYMSYDIKIHHASGDLTYFSKVSREKSGGETQTPFYVVIAASFEQLISERKKRFSPACFVLFDEAFNNMDESRIQAMMEFYSNLNIQLMIAVPPQRIDTIIPYVNTTLIVLKDQEESYIETFKRKEV